MRRLSLKTATTPHCKESVSTCVSHAIIFVRMRKVLLQWIYGILSVRSNISYKRKIKSRNTIHISPDGDFKGNDCLTSWEQPKVGNSCTGLCAGRALQSQVLSECCSWVSRLFSCPCPCHEDVGLEWGFLLVDVACASD